VHCAIEATEPTGEEFHVFPAFASAWLFSLLSFLHWVDTAPIVEDEEVLDGEPEIPDFDASD
jgi:hypothetical protein